MKNKLDLEDQGGYQDCIATNQRRSHMTLRDRLKRDLGKHRYNFTHLAEEAGITPSTLSRIFKGKDTSIRTATKLARAANRLTGLKTYTPLDFFTDL
jgi:transcriptional regulator with XRE-family HTH domain